MITLDSSALFALLIRQDQDHPRVVSALANESRAWIVPGATLGEVGYLLEQRATPSALDVFLADLEDGTYTLDCGEHDFARVRALVRRYADLPLGLVDAAVIACAERHGGRVLTLDLRHFGVVAREGTITILPS